MLRNAVSKVMWVGRATVFMVGLAVIVALVLGAASMAFAGNGDPWRLGQTNTATAITSLGGTSGVDGPMVRLTNNNSGTDDTALSLNVQGGEPPMTVNSSTKVAKLNADQLDGKGASEIGVNGLEEIFSQSAEDSNSSKTQTVRCPSGKIVVGTGFDVVGGKSGSSPNAETDVVVDEVSPGHFGPSDHGVTVTAYEETPTSAEWAVRAIAICATAP
jgi:hypothetical protein